MLQEDISADFPRYSVSQLIQIVARNLDELGFVVVEGSVTKIKKVDGRYIVFELSEIQTNGSNNQVAQITGWVFDKKAKEKFIALKIHERDQIAVLGTLKIYQRGGQVSIHALSFQKIGDSALLIELERRRKFFQEKGYFDLERKKNLPKFPSKIGIITSLSGGVVLADFLYWWKALFPACGLVVRDCAVQGKESVAEIVESLSYLNNREDVDLILIMRGGGSLSDLWTFNEVEVVEAIYASVKPVVTAIGHEADTTLADLVADLRCPTPTSAAKMVLPDRLELLRRLERNVKTLSVVQFLSESFHVYLRADESFNSSFDERYAKIKTQLLFNCHRLFSLNPVDHLKEFCLKFEHTLKSLTQSVKGNLQFKTISLMNLLRQLQLAALSEEIKKLSTRLVNCQQQSNFNIQKFFYDLKASLEAAKIQLFGVNPVKPLEEGFALVCNTEGEPLTFDQLQEGQNISVNFESGKVSATIIEKSHDSIYKRLTCSSGED